MNRNKTKAQAFMNENKQSSTPRNDAEYKLLKRISKRIKNDLVESKKTVDWLAVESETSRGSVRRIVDGEFNFTILTIDRISKALGYTDVVEFLKKC